MDIVTAAPILTTRAASTTAVTVAPKLAPARSPLQNATVTVELEGMTVRTLNTEELDPSARLIAP